MIGKLVLENGMIFEGKVFGYTGDTVGEVVFNTGMTGYQEVCTDPSYRGQMVVMTHPQIGNYGISPSANESVRPWLAALIVRDYAPFHNHWEAESSLHDWLARYGVPAVQGIDTRALTRLLRSKGTMKGVLFQREAPPQESELEAMLSAVQRVRSLSEKDLVGEVTKFVTVLRLFRTGDREWHDLEQELQPGWLFSRWPRAASPPRSEARASPLSLISAPQATTACASL
jgi:carbamoyl-phosphate synthase small subunit